jgi:hypothetical protein
MNPDLWRDALTQSLTDGWHILAELAQEDAENMRANPIDKRKARV